MERKRNNRRKFSRENEGGYLLQGNETHKFITHLKRLLKLMKLTSECSDQPLIKGSSLKIKIYS